IGGFVFIVVTVTVGATVECQFDATEAVQFGGWAANGFKLLRTGDHGDSNHDEDEASNHQQEGEAHNLTDDVNVRFRAPKAGAASIIARWTDSAGSHIQIFNYSIATPTPGERK